jgi:hypothetical protein
LVRVHSIKYLLVNWFITLDTYYFQGAD